MNVSKLYLGIKYKEKKLADICKYFSLKKYEIAFIGDDVNDLELLSSVGFSATPQDGIIHAKKIVDYTCDLQGGHGAFREFSDFILSVQFPKKTVWY
jgi:3-deoxy-D-manno-octulosonate 8-phosphate phosphatase (KDO 8-P phosphatase)